MTSARAAEGTWQLTDLIEQAPVLRTLADTLSDLVDAGRPIVACTADLKYSNGLSRFEARHPDRFFQFGISEQNMVSAAAGMATTGLEPFVATFASFLALLCAEQIRTDVAYPGLRVRLIGHHAGIALGFYGTSHHATEDIAITRSMAGLTVVAPADAASLAALLRAADEWPEPIYFRIGRGREPDVYTAGEAQQIRIGTAVEHALGRDLTLLATGSMVHPSLEAAAGLRRAGHDVGVVDLHTVKPLDLAALARASGHSRRLMTVEEHNVVGGLGGAVAEALADMGASVPLRRHGIQDEYSLIGPPTHLLHHYRLDAEGIAAVALEHLGAGGTSKSGGILGAPPGSGDGAASNRSRPLEHGTKGEPA
jgi:transketolase